MRVFDCVCEFGHEFEGWFESLESMNEQIENGWVNCPVCNSSNISRKLAAPHVQGFRDKEKAHTMTEREWIGEMRRQYYQAARTLIKDSENVGERFVQEARAVHAGTAPDRKIHGRCTLADAQELLEEGIGVLPLPGDVIVEKN